MKEAVNCTNSELSIFLRALGEGSLPISSLGMCPSVPSRSIPIASKSYQRGKKTVVFPGSRSLMTCATSTDNRGGGLLTSSRVDFPARTSVPPEGAPELKANDPDYGERWQELSVRYDRDTRSWKTHRCLWEEDLLWSSVTLPRWGMMRAGVLFQHPTRERPIDGTGFGFWPTPKASPSGPDYARANRDGSGGDDLATAVAKWPTPTRSMVSMADMEQARTAGNDPRRPSYSDAGTGQLNPVFVEWLMGWPIGWTDLKSLATGKFREWQRSHGRS